MLWDTLTMKIPDWLAKLPANGYINAKEVVSLFPQFSPRTTVQTLIKYGHVPPANARSGANRKLQWEVRYIRRWLREKV